MAVNKERILKLLENLQDALKKLKILQKYTLEDFLKSFEHYWAAERGLETAAQSVLDIGSHILAGHVGKTPESYESIISMLKENNIISSELSNGMKNLGKFRNVLVHGYVSIDHKKVFESLQGDLGAFEKFTVEISAWLKQTH